MCVLPPLLHQCCCQRPQPLGQLRQMRVALLIALLGQHISGRAKKNVKSGANENACARSSPSTWMVKGAVRLGILMVTAAAADSGALAAHNTPHLFATPTLRCGPHLGLVKFAPPLTVVPGDVRPTMTSGANQLRLRGGALGSGGMVNGDGGLRLTDQASAALQAAVDNARGRGNLEAQILKSTRYSAFIQ